MENDGGSNRDRHDIDVRATRVEVILRATRPRPRGPGRTRGAAFEAASARRDPADASEDRCPRHRGPNRSRNSVISASRRRRDTHRRVSCGALRVASTDGGLDSRANLADGLTQHPLKLESLAEVEALSRGYRRIARVACTFLHSLHLVPSPSRARAERTRKYRKVQATRLLPAPLTASLAVPSANLANEGAVATAAASSSLLREGRTS